MNPSSSRQTYLDWLRILAILGVLFFHSAMAYVAEWEWHIKNKETSNLLMEFNYWLSRFRMPLLFFISGTVAYFMLRSKSGWSFVGLRFRRLLIPLLFGMLVIVPPQIYVERLTQGYTGNYWQFWATVFEFKPYPAGGSFSWHHLWFILYLFIYDVLFTPLFKWTFSEKGQRAMRKLQWLAQGKRMYFLIVPGIIIYCSLVLKFPGTNDLIHDWCNIFYWLQFLLVGFIAMAVPGMVDAIERNRRVSLTVAFLSLILLNYLRWNDIEPWELLTNWKSDWRTYAYLAITPIMAWSWVLTGVGYGKKYMNKRHRVLDYLNQAVYPFYILHQSVMLVLVYYIVQVNETIGMKYIFTVGVTFFLSMGIYHLLIRPFPVMRFLFGMKPKDKAVPRAGKERTAVAEGVPGVELAN
ncbi:acyltransferase family protein [Paraflavitalea sp. CAU 1676]|uniref:acyltransferase family protein n=1 Tax=Paraflavitalea sp. CAU 1676 TaxID=3032598 RepID=UPI0023DC8412|nr:acyltransferase family protein [Paraflavitalea sp. CAU 1676]MDF2188922.1 acyltransferase family protein [Paraflavitalea sp. CAU 1676]